MNGFATLANGHDTLTVVQLQDIQEQDTIVVADEKIALQLNEHQLKEIFDGMEENGILHASRLLTSQFMVQSHIFIQVIDW